MAVNPYSMSPEERLRYTQSDYVDPLAFGVFDTPEEKTAKSDNICLNGLQADLEIELESDGNIPQTKKNDIMLQLQDARKLPAIDMLAERIRLFDTAIELITDSQNKPVEQVFDQYFCEKYNEIKNRYSSQAVDTPSTMVEHRERGGAIVPTNQKKDGLSLG